MAPVSWQERYRAIVQAGTQSPIVTGIEPLVLEAPVLQIRAHVGARALVEVFWNLDTGTMSCALIPGGQRILGADNTRGWHLHPFEDPERHIPCEAVALEWFLQQVEQRRHGWDQPPSRGGTPPAGEGGATAPHHPWPPACAQRADPTPRTVSAPSCCPWSCRSSLDAMRAAPSLLLGPAADRPVLLDHVPRPVGVAGETGLGRLATRLALDEGRGAGGGGPMPAMLVGDISGDQHGRCAREGSCHGARANRHQECRVVFNNLPAVVMNDIHHHGQQFARAIFPSVSIWRESHACGQIHRCQGRNRCRCTVPRTDVPCPVAPRGPRVPDDVPKAPGLDRQGLFPHQHVAPVLQEFLLNR